METSSTPKFNADYLRTAKLSIMPWHSPQDRELRGRIVAMIRTNLGGDGPSSNANMAQEIAKRFEVMLYMSSNTLEEYADVATLPDRIAVLTDMVTRAHGAKQ